MKLFFVTPTQKSLYDQLPHFWEQNDDAKRLFVLQGDYHLSRSCCRLWVIKSMRIRYSAGPQKKCYVSPPPKGFWSQIPMRSQCLPKMCGFNFCGLAGDDGLCYCFDNGITAYQVSTNHYRSFQRGFRLILFSLFKATLKWEKVSFMNLLDFYQTKWDRPEQSNCRNHYLLNQPLFRTWRSCWH